MSNRFRGEVNQIGVHGKFAFITCFKNREGFEENMYMPMQNFLGDFPTLKQGDLVGFDDYSAGTRYKNGRENPDGKSSTIRSARLLAREADRNNPDSEASRVWEEAGARPSRADPWARGQKQTGPSNPHKQVSALDGNKYHWEKAPKEDAQGAWVGGSYIRFYADGSAAGGETGKAAGPKGVPSKEMLLAIARGQTDVDRVKEELLKKEGRPVPAARRRSRSRSRSAGRREPGGAGGQPAPPSPPAGDAAALAAAVLSCRSFDDARGRHAAVIRQALAIGPAEELFRDHWAPGSEFHASLRNVIGIAAAKAGGEPAGEQPPPSVDAVFACATFDAAQERFPRIMAQCLRQGPAEDNFRSNWAPGSMHHASLRTFVAQMLA